MTLPFATALIIAIIAVIFSALFSGTEIAFVQSSKVRMEIDATRGGMIDRIIQRFSRHEDMFISTLLVGNNVVLVIYGIALSAIINPWLDTWFDGNEMLVLICNTLISTGIILLTGEFLPKTTFRINPHFTLRLIALPVYLIYLMLYPVSLLVSWISKGMMRIFGIREEKSEGQGITLSQLDDYLEQNIETSPDQGAVENEVKIFRKAIDFKTTQIGHCMIPRNEIVAVPVEGTSREVLMEKFISTGLSKIVVYKEDIDDIVGCIHVSEMFEEGKDWTKHLKPVIFTPETMLASKMMGRMLNERRSVAIVIDEFGGTAGLATLEDLVEEIFGEIEDEHDHTRRIGRVLADGSYEFTGRAEISTLNEEYNLGIKESDDYHTLAGYMLDSLGSIPELGKTYVIDHLRLTVLSMTAAKIELIRVQPLPDPQ